MFDIAIVGAGGIAKSHSQAILDNTECRLVAVADIIEERAREIADIHNAQYFTDYKEMCDKVKIDAVIINLPHFLHCEVSIYLMSKGIHVLVEKPMALNTDECDRMIAAAKQYNVKLAVGHVQKYYSAYREVKKIIDSGTLGKLCMITETRNIDYLPGRPEWFLKKASAGGGIVMNYGAHSLDKIMYSTGQKVKNVHSVVSNPLSDDDVEINAQILLELTNGVTATITYCGCHIMKEYEVSFYFTNGSAKISKGSNLTIAQNGACKEYGGTANLFEEQLTEFVKLLKDEPSEIATAQYGREIIEVIERIL